MPITTATGEKPPPSVIQLSKTDQVWEPLREALIFSTRYRDTAPLKFDPLTVPQFEAEEAR